MIPKKKNKTFSHKRSKQQEKQLAKLIGGRLVKGSGSGQEKGDVRKQGIVRIEAKTTKHESFRVTVEMLDKIEAAAISADEIPVVEIEFNFNGRRRSRSVCVVSSDYLHRIFLNED